MQHVIPNPSIPIKVIFEDESIIVIDKQAGVPCLPVKGDEKGTLANGIVARWPELLKIPPSPPFSKGGTTLPPPPFLKGDRGGFNIQAGLVHRLDNDTSGLIIAAKTKEIYDALRRQFDEKKILKQYTALVLGETPVGGVIETPIVHDPRDKKKMRTAPLTPTLFPEGEKPRWGIAPLRGRGGQTACTTYKLLKKCLAGQYSLLEITIKTGVRHQIRVHLASLGHPIAGDRLYQNTRQRARDKTGLARQFLHASKLGFTHPKTSKWVEFSSPLPDELRNVLTKLEKV